MNKLLFTLLGLLLLSSCSKSTQDQAEEAAKAELRKTLYHFDSYEPLETLVDSAFNIPEHNPLALDLCRQMSENGEAIKEANQAIESAKHSVALWSDSEGALGKHNYEKAQQDLQKAQNQLQEHVRVGLQIALDWHKLLEQADSPKFIGWKVVHKYRAKTKGGDPDIGTTFYVFSPDFKTTITTMDNDDFENLQSLVSDIKQKLPSREDVSRQLKQIDSIVLSRKDIQ